MQNFPSNQDISQFIGRMPNQAALNASGGFSNYASRAQNPGQNMQSYTPQMIMMNALMRSTPNSGANHAIGNGGYNTSFGTPVGGSPNNMTSPAGAPTSVVGGKPMMPSRPTNTGPASIGGFNNNRHILGALKNGFK